jgi:hypothetical protein
MKNTEDKDKKLISLLVDRRGINWLRDQLANISGADADLSILCDTAMHRVPTELLVGETHIFSTSQIDTESDASVQEHIEASCQNLANRLRDKKYREIRLFFSGHSLLPAFAKLTCYRVCHTETIDFGYFSNVGYRRIEIDLRATISV